MSGMKGKQDLKEDSPNVHEHECVYLRSLIMLSLETERVCVQASACMCVCVYTCVWKEFGKGFYFFFNSAFKEEITSNKRDRDCDLHCSRSLIKQDEHSPPERATKSVWKQSTLKSLFYSFLFLADHDFNICSAVQRRIEIRSFCHYLEGSSFCRSSGIS